MIKRLLPPLLAFCLLAMLLEVLVRLSFVNSSLIPSPSQIMQAFWLDRFSFLTALISSFTNILSGWIISIGVGFFIALVLSLSDWLKRAFLPFAIFFQTVPIIAVAPLLVIYFGFGNITVIVASAVVAIFPIIASTLIGLESVTEAELDLFRLYRANRWQILLKLRIPKAYPYLYSGMKIAAGLAVVGAVAGEFVAGGGLGAMVDVAKTQQRVDAVFVTLILLSLIGWILIALLKILNFSLNLYRPWGQHLKDH